MSHKVNYNFLLNVSGLGCLHMNSIESVNNIKWINKLNVCDCSNECIYQILQKEEKDRINDIEYGEIVGPSDLYEMVKNGLKEIVKNDCLDYGNLNSDGKELINWCVDYLKYCNENLLDGLEYNNIFEYINDFLKIKKESGYDYWLVNYLDNKGFVDHESNIMHAWYNEDNILRDREISLDRCVLFEQQTK